MTVEDEGPRPGGGSGPAPSAGDGLAAPPATGRPRGPRPAHEGSDLERYSALFASRTRVMTSSAMRDMMALTERPEVISLAGGLADTRLFPAEDLAAVLSRMAAEDAAKALQYSPTDGTAGVRACLAEVMAAEGMAVDPDDVLVTTGGQQVIDLVCKTLVDPGDVVIAEAPTYPGAVPTFSAYQADVRQIELDDDGMRIDLLEETLAQLDLEGRRPKFLYVIPNFQNPGGVTLSLERRRRLVEIAHERRLLVLEDNPYGLLNYDADPTEGLLPTLFTLDGGRFVIYAGTLSKILSPGIRVGWAVAPGPVRQKMNVGKQGSDLNSSSLSQYFVTHFFRHHDWRAYVDVQRETYRRRRDVMLETLEATMPEGTTWTRPGGGLFVWVTFPDVIDTTDLLARAIERDVAFVPGRGAFLDGRGGSSMRINFSGVEEDDIREGVRRIAAAARDQLDLYRSLTGGPRAAHGAGGGAGRAAGATAGARGGRAGSGRGGETTGASQADPSHPASPADAADPAVAVPGARGAEPGRADRVAEASDGGGRVVPFPPPDDAARRRGSA